MNATILCVGKLKEKWQADGCAEYLKRLSRYGKYEVIAVDDVREPDKPSDALIKQVMDKEGAALMKYISKIDPSAFVTVYNVSEVSYVPKPRA